MTRVIERCPSCGVEHDVRVDGCEACGTALRYWCRAHSREIGWLETAECRRCAEEEARRMPRRRPVAASPHAAPPAPAPPPRPPSSVPPYWCTIHGPEIGFMATPVCPRCAAEEVAHAPAPPAAPPPAPARGRRTMAAPPPPAVAPAAAASVTPELPAWLTAELPEMPREPEPEREPERERPAASVARGVGGAVLRIFDALLTMLWAVIVCVLLGVPAGAIYAFTAGADIPMTAVEWGVYGGMLGVVIGFFSAFGPYIFADVPVRKRR